MDQTQWPNQAGFNQVSAGHGWHWLREGFEMLRQNLFAWMVFLIALIIVTSVIQLVPLGGLVMIFIGPVFSAAVYYACVDAQNGKPPALGGIFEGFRRPQAKALVGLGGLTFLLAILALAVVAVLVAVLMPDSMHGMQAMHGMDEMPLEAATPMLLVLAISMVLLLPLMAALWFATPLVAISQLPPSKALKLSLRAFMGNLGAVTVYGLLLILFGVLAMIPLGLGLLLLIPVMALAQYVSYVDVFAPKSEKTPESEPFSLID